MDTLAAAQLRIVDHQADTTASVRPGRVALALGLLMLGMTSPAAASGWLSCSAAGLEPPAVVSRQAPPYPESARLAGAEGYVEVAFTVLRDGRVGWLRILNAEPSGFFESAASDGVRDWRFEPARQDGQPVECRIQTRVRFALTDTVAVRPDPRSEATARPAPVYPEAARIAGLEGYVEVAFDVDAQGRARDPEVTLAMPRGEFETAALTAIRAWQFAADAVVPGRQTRRFEFSLPDSYPRPPAVTLLAAAPLPAEACTRRIGGRVRMEVETDADGRITDARVIDATPANLFDESALAIARNSRMAPAYQNGVPVAATALLTLRFEPDAAHCPGGVGDDPRGRPGRGPATPTFSNVR